MSSIIPRPGPRSGHTATRLLQDPGVRPPGLGTPDPGPRSLKQHVSARGDLDSVSDLLDLRTVNATWHAGPCAEVRVGEHVTRYVRRGSGPGAVLLGAESGTSPVWASLIEWLDVSFRVTVPQAPSNGIDRSEWLRGFIEGLGLSSFVLVAGSEFCAAALDLAAVDDFTVSKLVLLPDESSSVGRSGTRALWIRPEWAPNEALRRIEKFLLTEE